MNKLTAAFASVAGALLPALALAQPAAGQLPPPAYGPQVAPAHEAAGGPVFGPLPPFMGPPRPGYSTPPYPPIPPDTAVWSNPTPPVPRGAWWHGAMVPYPHQRVVYYPTWDMPGHRPVGVWAPEVPQGAVPAYWKRFGQGKQSPPG